MHHPTNRIAHTTAFVTPVVEHLTNLCMMDTHQINISGRSKGALEALPPPPKFGAIKKTSPCSIRGSWWPLTTYWVTLKMWCGVGFFCFVFLLKMLCLMVLFFYYNFVYICMFLCQIFVYSLNIKYGNSKQKQFYRHIKFLLNSLLNYCNTET